MSLKKASMVKFTMLFALLSMFSMAYAQNYSSPYTDVLSTGGYYSYSNRGSFLVPSNPGDSRASIYLPPGPQQRQRVLVFPPAPQVDNSPDFTVVPTYQFSQPMPQHAYPQAMPSYQRGCGCR